MKLFCKHEKSKLISLNYYKNGTILNLKCENCDKQYKLIINKKLCYDIVKEKKKVDYLESQVELLEHFNDEHLNEIIELRDKLFENSVKQEEFTRAKKLIQIQAPFVADSKNMAVRVLTQLQTELVINPQVNISKIINDLLKDLKGE